MFDRDGNLTDDSDRWACGAVDTFDCDPGGDYDPMYDRDDGPRCGGPVVFADSPDRRNVGCPGCRHCDAPDHELKPAGFGLERHESPAYQRAVAHFRNEWRFVTGRHDAHPMEHMNVILRWAVAGGWNPKLTVAAERKWWSIIDRAETHAQAVAEYTAWADWATKRMQR